MFIPERAVYRAVLDLDGAPPPGQRVWRGRVASIATELHVSPADAALLISASTVGLLLSVLTWSWIADRIGRVRAMKISLITATLLGLAVAAWPGLRGILVLRLLEGIALGGLPAVAMAYLREEIHASRVAVAAALYISGTSVGGLLGRVVAAPVSGVFGWRAGILCVSVIGAISTVVFLVAIPAPRGFGPTSKPPQGVLRTILAHLRRPAMVVLFLQGFFLMGSLVAVYNYLAFRLEGAPFHWSPTAASLLFFAYLAGTVSATVAGNLVVRRRRIDVLCGSSLLMILGLVAMLGTQVLLVIAGLLVFTAGFFGAHAVASGWVAIRAREGAAQAASLYNLFYYGGSSLFGWLCGLVFVAHGWTAMVLSLQVLVAAAVVLALASWHWGRHAEP